MDLSIVIVNWNTKILLKQCLKSIFENPPLGTFEIWVVDNASSDGSTGMVRVVFPEVNLIDNEKNMGFGYANNLALELCRGTYILILNPDTEVLPGAIESLYAYLDVNPKAGVAGACLLYSDGTLQTSCYPYPTLIKEFWRLLHLDRIQIYGIYDQTHWDQNEVHKVDVIQGAALMVRKVVLDQVGFFDPEYFMYTEEVDLCYQIHKAGWDLYWIPESKIIHHEGQSTKQMPVEMFLHLYKSKLLFIRKHYGAISGMIYKLILGFTALPRLLPFSKTSSPAQGEEKKDIAQNYQQLLISLRKM